MEWIKEYVTIKEKDFWKKESLELNISWRILDSDLRKVVEEKVSELNKKIDAKYDVWIAFLDNWEFWISDIEKDRLISQLREIIRGFNEEISRIEEEYIGIVAENIQQIREDINSYFQGKSLFVETSSWLWSLRAYAMIDRDMASFRETKKLEL